MPVTFKNAVVKSMVAPAIVVERLVIGLGRIIMRESEA